MKVDLRHVFTNRHGDALKVTKDSEDVLTLRDAVFIAIETEQPTDSVLPMKDKLTLYRARNRAIGDEPEAEFTDEEIKMILARATPIFTIPVVGQLVELLDPSQL